MANKELYAAYIDEGMTPELFCRTAIEPLDVDADNVSVMLTQIQIMVVFNYFDLPMRIVYLDNSDSDTTNDMQLPDGQVVDNVWLLFLYRPGHYDLVYA